MDTMHKKEREWLRIYIGEGDRRNGHPLYRVILEEASRLNMAGVSVFKGLAGFGANSQIHFAEILRLSENLPIVIEVVDEPEKLDGLLVFLENVMDGGMILRDSVNVVWP